LGEVERFEWLALGAVDEDVDRGLGFARLDK
jgi:hypothetical protein